jgi:hypothetical protein
LEKSVCISKYILFVKLIKNSCRNQLILMRREFSKLYSISCIHFVTPKAMQTNDNVGAACRRARLVLPYQERFALATLKGVAKKSFFLNFVALAYVSSKKIINIHC